MLRTLLINPPIYDFTAYDFWLRPYGMLRAAARLRHLCEFTYFDFLTTTKRDVWGRGRFASEIIPRPRALADIPRHFRRFGRSRLELRSLLAARVCDLVLIQTSMTYWYPGVKEVIDDVRELRPRALIVLGGVYATLCPDHAATLGADLVIEGDNFAPLLRRLTDMVAAPATLLPDVAGGLIPEEKAAVGVIKLSDGCPFHCTYCAAPLFWQKFTPRPPAQAEGHFRRLVASGATDIAFYDDALLYRPETVLLPFLDAVTAIAAFRPVRLHTPNALNARFMTAALARRMVGAGFASFYFGLESGSAEWQRATGGKVNGEEFAAAVAYLREAGARNIFAYIIAGHPDSGAQDVEAAIHLALNAGVRVMLSEFSPVPGTPDAGKSARWYDPAEPLTHNKTAFAMRRLGADYLNRIKTLAHNAAVEVTQISGKRRPGSPPV